MNPTKNPKATTVTIFVPDYISSMTVGEFIETEMPSSGIRPTMLLARPQDPSCGFSTIKDMPLPAFITHCRGWYLTTLPACGISFVVKLSKRLKEFGVDWG